MAGLWNTWTDKATGEVHESFTMLTLNADQHSLMNRMHTPGPKLAADKQDKRTVVPLEAHDFDRWLTCTVETMFSRVCGIAMLRLRAQDACRRSTPHGPRHHRLADPRLDRNGPAVRRAVRRLQVAGREEKEGLDRSR